MSRHFRFVRWAVVAVFGVVAAAWSEEGEKLLFGFEKEEVEKIAQGKSDIATFDGDGDFIFFPPEPMVCSREKASAGKYSCKVVERVDPRRPTDPAEPRIGMFQLPFHRLWALRVGEPQANLLLP